MITISVIIPVYNAEKYLRKCLESLLNQSFKHFEVIIVDDGAKDGSSFICDEYAEKDVRFNVYHIKNGGVSNARNYGINKAKGTYITFIDSDDFVSVDFLENLIKVTRNNTDFVLSGISYFGGDYSDSKTEKLTDREYDIGTNFQDCYSVITMPTITSPCCKLYKREIIVKHKLSFNNNLTYGEDRDFNIRFLPNINTVCSCSYIGYHYRRGIATSLSQSKDYEKQLMVDLDYWSKLYTFLTAKGDEETLLQFLATKLFHIFNDRFIQITQFQDLSFSNIQKLFREYSKTPQFNWLYCNMDKVNNRTLIAKFYRWHLLFLVPIIYLIQKCKYL